ncbi:MAG: hypothetical protein HQK54_13100, partial [Oligoflexales bacterium]|nr:hypothetical protein [Oligoflexales bacterium]
MRSLIVLFLGALLSFGCGIEKNINLSPENYDNEDNNDSSTDQTKESRPERQGQVYWGPIKNLDYLTSRLMPLDWYGQAQQKGFNPIIAVLDNGFVGIDEVAGKTLPNDIRVEMPAEENPITTVHGTKMAEIAFAVATGKSVFDPSIKAPLMK